MRAPEPFTTSYGVHVWLKTGHVPSLLHAVKLELEHADCVLQKDEAFVSALPQVVDEAGSPVMQQ